MQLARVGGRRFVATTGAASRRRGFQAGTKVGIDGDRDGKEPARITSFGHGGGGKQSAGSSAEVVQIHAAHLGGLSQP